MRSVLFCMSLLQEELTGYLALLVGCRLHLLDAAASVVPVSSPDKNKIYQYKEDLEAAIPPEFLDAYQDIQGGFTDLARNLEEGVRVEISLFGWAFLSLLIADQDTRGSFINQCLAVTGEFL